MHTVLQSCKSKKQPLDQSGLQLLIDEYIHRWGDSYKLEDQWWGDKKLTWEEAIARAWKSRLSHGKMYGHQCRVANKLHEGLEVALADKKQPEDFKDFQSVYDWVQSIVARVKGLGATTAYDVARRLGAWLRLEPVVVYLHAGTAAGARKFGDRIDFIVETDGRVYVQPVNIDVEMLKGILYKPGRKPVSVEEMNEAIAQRGGEMP